jgi:maleate isomerase
MVSLPNLATCKKIGFIVPSSNTAVEPTTQAIFQCLNEKVICIFTRIQVKTVGTDAKSGSQFSAETMVEAARLLADAAPDCILWNGTSGMWVPGASLEVDRKLAQAMQDATGIPCSTNTIATVKALDYLKAKKVAIAVPYAEPLAEKVAEFFTGCGYEVTAAERLEQTPPSNLEIARSKMEDIDAVIRRCASSGCDVIIVACTNWPASGLVHDLEQELEIPIIDSINVTAWWALRMIGLDGSKAAEWGRLFQQ